MRQACPDNNGSDRNVTVSSVVSHNGSMINNKVVAQKAYDVGKPGNIRVTANVLHTKKQGL